jgi:hypothetical protein
MKDSEILREAKKGIENGTHYICWAIQDVDAQWQRKRSLIDWVMHMLKFCGTYESWMGNFHTKTYNKMGHDDFKEGRMQWLNWMIAECEKQEAQHGPA